MARRYSYHIRVKFLSAYNEEPPRETEVRMASRWFERVPDFDRRTVAKVVLEELEEAQKRIDERLKNIEPWESK